MISPSAQQVLYASPLLAGVPKPEAEPLISGGRERVYASGEELFHQGAEPEYLHILLSGRVKIWRGSESGAPVTLHTFGPGEPLGCVAVLRQIPFPATATALDRSVTACIPRKVLARAMQGSQALTAAALAIVGQR